MVQNCNQRDSEMFPACNPQVRQSSATAFSTRSEVLTGVLFTA